MKKPYGILLTFFGSFAFGQFTAQDDQAYGTFESTRRFGLLPAKLEDAIFESLGPRFSNAILSGKPSDSSLSTCLSCALPLTSDLACIYKSMRSGELSTMAHCGVRKAEVCNCVSCTDPLIEAFLNRYCADTSAPEAAESSSILDTSFASSVDPSVKAFLGTATSVDLDAAKFHIFGSIGRQTENGAEPICQLSEECRCCLGAPSPNGKCAGECMLY